MFYFRSAYHHSYNIIYYKVFKSESKFEKLSIYVYFIYVYYHAA